MEQDGLIAANLDALYDYMLRRLVTTHAENSTAILDEVTVLPVEIKSGWNGIRSEVANMSGHYLDLATMQLVKGALPII